MGWCVVGVLEVVWIFDELVGCIVVGEGGCWVGDWGYCVIGVYECKVVWVVCGVEVE